MYARPKKKDGSSNEDLNEATPDAPAAATVVASDGKSSPESSTGLNAATGEKRGRGRPRKVKVDANTAEKSEPKTSTLDVPVCVVTDVPEIAKDTDYQSSIDLGEPDAERCEAQLVEVKGVEVPVTETKEVDNIERHVNDSGSQNKDETVVEIEHDVKNSDSQAMEESVVDSSVAGVNEHGSQLTGARELVDDVAEGSADIQRNCAGDGDENGGESFPQVNESTDTVEVKCVAENDAGERVMDAEAVDVQVDHDEDIGAAPGLDVGLSDSKGVVQAEESSKDEGGSRKGRDRPKTFVEMLEQQLASTRSRLPDSFYAENLYSTVDNQKLPEGCKTLMDFFNIPKNFDFKSMVDLALHGGDSMDSLDAYATKEVQAVENPVYSGPYPDSFFENIFHPKPHQRRYSTAEGEPEPAALDEVYDQLKGKEPGELVPPAKASPLEKIKEHYLMFDGYGYIKHYLTHLNQYNYGVISSHHKRDDTLNYYLNNEYTERMPRKFPPEPGHTDKIREYFTELLPEVMDNLVNLIRNDPNKDRIPSPPLHDMTFAPGFNPPDYMHQGYETDDERTGGFQEEDFRRFASLEGLHQPEKYLHYPYADLEPLYQRQLLATYLDLVKTGELGEPERYKKFKAQAASIRNETYTDQTKPPVEIYGDMCHKKAPLCHKPAEETASFTKVYERGSRKTSVALVYLEPGNGHIIINNRDGYQYVRYCTQRIREMLEPLDALYVYKKFNVVAVAHGGGISGQAGAIRNALARYLTKVLAPKVEPYLAMRRLTEADTRQVERKKTNLRKARKKEHYSKR
ncbi:ribosomal protein S9/S16 [Babesia caballi]|uniref:Ribosomal protein S9/S16 n=1 Tax=Babesia caballi TaxID=5871 RepID=A0AAV4LMD0_BABCB|nr:ribosomal protein S9/S16 [Babesia caballi]